MGMLGGNKNAPGVNKARDKDQKATTIPSLEEIQDQIIATELGVKKHLEKVVELETTRKVLFDEAFAGASAEARSKFRIRQKELDCGIKMEMTKAKALAKKLDNLLDAELFMRIKEGFSRSGFECPDGATGVDFESVQHELDEKSSRLGETLAHADGFATSKEPSMAFASEAQTMEPAPGED